MQLFDDISVNIYLETGSWHRRPMTFSKRTRRSSRRVSGDSKKDAEEAIAAIADPKSFYDFPLALINHSGTTTQDDRCRMAESLGWGALECCDVVTGCGSKWDKMANISVSPWLSIAVLVPATACLKVGNPKIPEFTIIFWCFFTCHKQWAKKHHFKGRNHIIVMLNDTLNGWFNTYTSSTL